MFHKVRRQLILPGLKSCRAESNFNLISYKLHSGILALLAYNRIILGCCGPQNYSGTRREYFLVGSPRFSLLQTVPEKFSGPL
jgi:hypothetical protein